MNQSDIKVIISPAKKMVVDLETIEPYGLPRFIDETQCLMRELQRRNIEELKELWKCNDKITEENYGRLEKMDLCKDLTPAILSYDGIQYKYMAPTVFETSMLSYIQEHLCILSGFYGALRPMDGVTPYRLEMQAKLPVQENKNLYEFWGDKIYQAIAKGPTVIINLASKEYSVCIERHVRPEDTFITCVFGEMVNGKVVQKGTYAKMVRGEMIRFMAENRIQNVEDIKKFTGLGYCFKEKLSTENQYTFLKNE